MNHTMPIVIVGNVIVLNNGKTEKNIIHEKYEKISSVEIEWTIWPALLQMRQGHQEKRTPHGIYDTE